MRCGTCGNELPGAAKFCNKCGTAAPPPVWPSHPAPEPEAGARRPRSAKRKPGGGAKWVALAVLVSGGAITAAVLWKKRGGGEHGKVAVGKPDTENLPPHVASLTGKHRLALGESAELVATIVDPEKDPYYAWWTASCGVVASRAGTPGRALFFAPSTPGPCAVTLDLRDRDMHRAQRLQYTIDVEAR